MLLRSILYWTLLEEKLQTDDSCSPVKALDILGRKVIGRAESDVNEVKHLYFREQLSWNFLLHCVYTLYKQISPAIPKEDHIWYLCICSLFFLNNLLEITLLLVLFFLQFVAKNVTFLWVLCWCYFFKNLITLSPKSIFFLFLPFETPFTYLQCYLSLSTRMWMPEGRAFWWLCSFCIYSVYSYDMMSVH